VRANRMKEKLHAGAPAFGVSVMIPSPQLVEMLGAYGFDWVLLDCEHGTLSLESVELMTMAAEAAGMTPIARPVSNSPAHILQVLDRGVAGVQVPHVRNAAEARAAVSAVKFHPLGGRSLAAGTRAAAYDAHGSMAEHVRSANAHTLIAAQIEDREALAHLDEILSVEEIDVFFVGPSDLSQSMGHPGNPKAPEVARAIEDCLTRIRAAGRISGMPATAEQLGDALAKGVRYIYTHVPRLIAASARSYFEAARGQGAK